VASQPLETLFMQFYLPVAIHNEFMNPRQRLVHTLFHILPTNG